MPSVQFIIGRRAWSLQAEGDSSLLDIALSAGVPVSYACKRGDCGQCIGLLASGLVAPIDLTRPSAVGDAIYLCNVVPKTEAEIRIPIPEELAAAPVIRSPCKISSVVRLSESVVELILRLPPNVPFRHFPGQYIRLKTKEGISRSYSLAPAPTPDGLLRIHIRHIHDGRFSEYAFGDARPGDLLFLEGPMGQFVLRNDIAAKKTIFLATGVGVAPICAILMSMDNEQLARCGQMYLYWGNRFARDFYLQFDAIVARTGLQVNRVTSGPEERPDDLAGGYVQQLMKLHHADLSDAQIFACGNASMIRDARALAVSSGLQPDRFFSDTFCAS